MSSYPRIVVLSIPKSGKSTLFQGLSRYFEFDYKKKPEREEKLGNHVLSVYEVDVFTKYYLAHIELCFVSGNNATLSSEELKTLISDNCQGVIFVCRSMDTSALDVIKKWNAATIEKSDNMELRLLVCSFGDIQNATTEKNLKTIKDWCIDNFYEMIPANLRVPHHSWQSQDKEGVARVVEDMECVMWSNMDTSKRRTTERVIEESVIANKEEQDQCAFCHKSKSVDNIPLYLCSRCRTVSYCSRDCQVKDWKNHKTFCNQVSGLDPVAKAKEEEEKRVKEVEATMTMSIPQPPKSKEEEEFDHFAQLMQECRDAKLQAKNLPDAERKRRAAIMAAKLMKEFGLSENNEAEKILEDCNAKELIVCSLWNQLVW